MIDKVISWAMQRGGMAVLPPPVEKVEKVRRPSGSGRRDRRARKTKGTGRNPIAWCPSHGRGF